MNVAGMHFFKLRRGMLINSGSAFIFLLVIPATAAEEWPTIQERLLHITQTRYTPLRELPVLLKTGEKRYVLGCMHTPQAELYQGNWGAFSGMFQCKLIDLKDGADILQPVDEWGSTVTRARFYHYEVMGGCRKHQWYGHRREFHVHGMKVVLDIVDFVPGSTIQPFYDDYRFTLNVAITNDKSANSAWGGYAPEICRVDNEYIDKYGKLQGQVSIIRGANAF